MKKILVVEDNELNRKLFCDILTYNNFDVACAVDGIEAYNKIKGSAFDLIILDIQLPKLDGFSLLKKIKDENIKTAPIIITSAYAMDTDKSKAKEFKITHYITKPIDINNFVKTVKNILN